MEFILPFGTHVIFRHKHGQHGTGLKHRCLHLFISYLAIEIQWIANETVPRVL